MRIEKKSEKRRIWSDSKRKGMMGQETNHDPLKTRKYPAGLVNI